MASINGDAAPHGMPDPVLVLPLLFGQPTEIIGLILHWLDIKDLFNLRLSNRRLHTLVHDHQHSICAAFCRRLQRGSPGITLPSRIASHPLDLAYYLRAQRHVNGIAQLSEIMASHITNHITYIQLTDKINPSVAMTRAAYRLRNRLIPALSRVQNFLEQLKAIIAEAEIFTEDWDDETFASCENMFQLDQQDLIEAICLDPLEIWEMQFAYRLFIGVCRGKGFAQNTRVPKYPFATVKRILLYRGLLPFVNLLRSTTDGGSRRDALVAANAQLFPLHQPLIHSRPPLATIYHLNKSSLWSCEPKKRRPYRVINKFVERQDIWVAAAHAVLQRRTSAPGLNRDINIVILDTISAQDIGAFRLGNWALS
jgi:hypothetical protein